MKKKLLVLDLVLALLAAALAREVRTRWLEARKREQVVFSRRVAPLPPPPFRPLPAVEPLSAAGYAEIVNKNLFSVDRNPTVIIEVAPPKPMPALPVFYGLMNLGDGPLAIMSAKEREDPHEVRFGEKVGEYTLVRATGEEVELEWEGKTVKKRVAEIAVKEPEAAPASRAAAAPAPAAPQPKPEVVKAATPGPGTVDMGGGFRSCAPGDTSPAGTIVGGMRKRVSRMPMGESCLWEPVK
ncbi:MAG: hypothetical protein ACM336_08960 [Acidobacteriota bacterium]